ncbi:transglutaminase-like domain-containing protein [Clostridium chauvoei]|uniref:transglutaminase-like domain-containing protein n=1 Tax=Clostridium chauvoei TaxID=46867 RepID=UPI001C864B54|nr:transglutaminase-like domain-containing protein [Clostridium chauvoei]MBX7331192.1 transglutaminase-like domain-containing protein [Clostridium chauvoei]
MSTYLSYGLCLLIMIWAVKGSTITSFQERDAKYALNRLIYYFSIFISLLVIILNLDKLIIKILEIGNKEILKNFNVNLFNIICLAICFFLIQFLIYQSLKFLCRPFIGGYSKVLKGGKLKTLAFSTVFGMLKGFVIILIVFIAIVTFNNTITRGTKITIFDNLKAYARLEGLISINKPVLSNNDVSNYSVGNSNFIIYYNGVTLEEVIKSTEKIDNKALELTYDAKSDREIAKNIYSWIGSNIEYDVYKAEKALNNEGKYKSGAIEAFESRTGICFDYACLYVAMARKVGLKVRLITGQGFDGKSFGPHAWNEVYLSDEDKWIKVDSTFYKSGDYFDTEGFDKEHIKESVAGEW